MGFLDFLNKPKSILSDIAERSGMGFLLENLKSFGQRAESTIGSVRSPEFPTYLKGKIEGLPEPTPSLFGRKLPTTAKVGKSFLKTGVDIFAGTPEEREKQIKTEEINQRLMTATPEEKKFWLEQKTKQGMGLALGTVSPLKVGGAKTIEEVGEKVVGKMEEDPVQKVITALKEAKPIRKAQEALYTKARGEKMAKALEVGEKVKGEKGFYAELGQFKGELPKVQYESLRGKIGQVDIDSLFNKVKESPLLNDWDRLTAREGLAKVFGQYGGQVPTKGELKLLEKTFGPDFVKAVSEKRPLLEKLSEAGYQLFNIPRSLMASFDMSAPLRQGAFLIGRPKQFFSSFAKMFKVFPSEKAFTELQQEIASRPTFNLMQESKLALTEMDDVLGVREEKFMSNWAEKIPVLGKMVRGSGRAYTGFLNKLRADVFDDLVRKADNLGLDSKANPTLLTDLAGFINNATGRGSLGSLERAATALNTLFFSPRLMASRLNLLNPVYYAKLTPFVRKESLKSLFTFAGTGLTVLTLAKMGGAEVGTDPRSADFGKIKIGNTRVDIWGGFQQYVRLAAQLYTGKLVSTTTGKVMTLGEGYKPLTRYDILQRTVEAKEAPIFSFATALLRGQGFGGEKLSWSKEIGSRFVPMVVQDAYDLYKEDPTLLPLAALGWFGVGMQTYKPEKKSVFTGKSF